jgi:hypothetical protein
MDLKAVIKKKRELILITAERHGAGNVRSIASVARGEAGSGAISTLSRGCGSMFSRKPH